MTPADPGSIMRQVAASRRYRHVCDDTVRRISEAAATAYPNEKQAVKAVKRKLHQMYASFLTPEYHRQADQLLEQLHADGFGPDDATPFLSLHASTRERLPYYAELYRELAQRTGPWHRVLDLACGLNPFSVAFMDQEKLTSYVAWDIDRDTVRLLNGFFDSTGLPGTARLGDLILDMPDEPADIAFLMKLLPVLEQQEKGISGRLLSGMRARWLVITFPVLGLTGNPRRMRAQHEQFMERLISAHTGPYRFGAPFLVGSELVYVAQRRSNS